MTTYTEYIKREIALGIASKNNKDKVKARFIELHVLTDRDKIQQVEYTTLENAMRLRFKSEQADQKAKNLLGKAESESRKIDSHAKILIGLAAIELARTHPDLNKRLLSSACAITSAPIGIIQTLLRVDGANSLDSVPKNLQAGVTD